MKDLKVRTLRIANKLRNDKRMSGYSDEAIVAMAKWIVMEADALTNGCSKSHSKQLNKYLSDFVKKAYH